MAAAVVCLNILHAQQKNSNPFIQQEYQYRPTSYIGLSTGINNSVGLIGAQLKFVISPKAMIDFGAGLGSWGYKLSANVEIMPKGINGIFVKAGYMHATGLEDIELEVETSGFRNEYVRFDLEPVGNVFFSVGNAWKLGKKNRFYIEGGYAIPLVTDDYYEILSGETLSDDSELLMQMMRPGGLILALGFDFGI